MGCEVERGGGVGMGRAGLRDGLGAGVGPAREGMSWFRIWDDLDRERGSDV